MRRQTGPVASETLDDDDEGIAEALRHDAEIEADPSQAISLAKIVVTPFPSYCFLMSTILEVERLALELSEQERATLALNLLDSLRPILSDEDEGIAEALRRDAEIEADHSQAISLAKLDLLIGTSRQ